LRSSGLRGFDIPGTVEPLLAALFADDTTAFLRDTDSLPDLLALLGRWCAAARAKFNDDKTVILPVGTATYRERVCVQRRLTEAGPVIPSHFHIARDGEPTRILGAWLGNKIDQAVVWERMIDTVRTNLARWGQRHPTMYGRKLIVDIELGARTQFLARAQGMPGPVLDTLQRIALRFVWKDETHARVNADTVYRPVAEGGLNLLNLKHRQDAIALQWLREYLCLNGSRP
ncbi:hypothetical protein FKP32DRAFT_1546809, partial [Trametes sanguinea]